MFLKRFEYFWRHLILLTSIDNTWFHIHIEMKEQQQKKENQINSNRFVCNFFSIFFSFLINFIYSKLASLSYLTFFYIFSPLIRWFFQEVFWWFNKYVLSRFTRFHMRIATQPFFMRTNLCHEPSKFIICDQPSRCFQIKILSF